MGASYVIGSVVSRSSRKERSVEYGGCIADGRGQKWIGYPDIGIHAVCLCAPLVLVDPVLLQQKQEQRRG